MPSEALFIGVLDDGYNESPIEGDRNSNIDLFSLYKMFVSTTDAFDDRKFLEGARRCFDEKRHEG
jgi:hypothetical protein